MAKHNIQFKGIRHTPSDITGQDGDLLECVNLVNDGGELRPIEMFENGFVMAGSGDKLAAVHNVSSGKNFVFAKYDTTNNRAVITVRNSSNFVVGNSPFYISGEVVQWVETVGNTLVIGTDKSTYYAVYKGATYKWLGDKIPQPVFRFDFSRTDEYTDGQYNGHWIDEYDPKMYTLLGDGEPIPGGGVALDAGITDAYISPNSPQGKSGYMKLANETVENKKIFRDGIMARYAQAMNDTKLSNVFVYPFFVRYAVRMYDGSYVMHSAPILMIPSSLVTPLLSFMYIYQFGDYIHKEQHDSDDHSYVDNT